MNIENSIKIKTLNVTKDSLEGVLESQRLVRFKDSNSNVLAEMPFKELDLSNTLDYYLFSSGSVSKYVLRGEVALSGVVSRFEIDGLNASSVFTTGILTGTVGNLYSDADLKCNRLNWLAGRIITWNNLALKIRS